MLSVFVLIARQGSNVKVPHLACKVRYFHVTPRYLFVPDAQNPSAISGACKKFVPLQIETVVDRIFE